MQTLTAIPAQPAPARRREPRPSVRRGAGRVPALLQDPAFWLVCCLAAIAFWPVPVDRDARGIIDALVAMAPWLSYENIEFSANIVMFVPLGYLVMKTRALTPLAVVAIACCTSLSMEIVQGLLLHARTQSVLDVVAHTLGAALGVELALFARQRRQRAFSPRV